LQVVGSCFNGTIYKGLPVIPDIPSLPPVPNFTSMISPTQIEKTSQSIAYSFPSPFPTIRYKCTHKSAVVLH